MPEPAPSEPKILTYKGRKYDVSRWLEKHPGGAEVLEYFIGTDATVPMHMFHDMRSELVQRWLPRFDRGPDEQRPLSEFDNDYLELEKTFIELGWFRPSLPWFLYKTTVTLGFLLAAVSVENPWFKGLLLGLFVQQSAFLAHDTCHNGAFPRSIRERMGWFFGSVGLGLNHGRWTRQHNLHHLINNRPLDDPQINNMPEILYFHREVETFEKAKRPLSHRDKWMMGYAHLWLLPVLFFYGRANAMRAEIKHARRAIRGDTQHKQEAVSYLRGWLLHVGVYALVIASSALQGGVRAALWSLLIVPLMALGVSGILHLQLILSHGYRPRLYKEEQEKLGMKIQIFSNQNVTASFVTAWFHGGLENHIEHHLFPRMPRHNLPKLRPYVRKLCDKHGLTYNTDPFAKCVWEFLSSLKRESAPFRTELAQLRQQQSASH
jgi:delta8-fatty-acid desaturase